MIPCAQRLSHGFAPRSKVNDLTLDGVPDLVGGPPSGLACPAPAVPDLHEPGDLAEREAEALGISDEREPVDDGWRKETIAGARSRGFQQETEAFIVADGVDADARQRRGLSDRHEVVHASW